MEEKQFSARVAEYKAMVEGYLSSCLSEAQRASYHKLTEAMQYSLMAGGKRLRPMLVLEFCRRRRKGAARCLRHRDAAHLFAHSRRSSRDG